MKEADWLVSEDPRAMLGHLWALYLYGRGRHDRTSLVTDRKKRLFVTACWRALRGGPARGSEACRRCKGTGIWPEPDLGYFVNRCPDCLPLQAVEAAEWYADGLATEEDLRAVRRELPSGDPARLACSSIELLHPPRSVPPWPAPAVQAALLRDLFGNPFRPVTMVPCKWCGREDCLGCLPAQPVFAIARSLYDDRRFDGLPVLCDALEEAGCTDPQILGHGRSAGPHVRGCWLLDLLLGKS